MEQVLGQLERDTDLEALLDLNFARLGLLITIRLIGWVKRFIRIRNLLLFASSRRKLEVYKNKGPELSWEGNFKQVQEGLISFLT